MREFDFRGASALEAHSCQRIDTGVASHHRAWHGFAVVQWHRL